MSVSRLVSASSGFLLFALALVGVAPAVAQDSGLARVVYSPSDEHFPNPERGFYNYTEGFPGGSVLRADDLRRIRGEAKTLIISLYNLNAYRDRDLPETFFTQLDGDFAAMREAGIKSVLRFRYSKRETEPDAPLEWVLRHLDQLQPVFERNYDVIATAQAGFIGAWGEWHASHNNLTSLPNMRAILFRFMEVLPERAIQIRYPEAKMQIFSTNTPLSEEEAFSGTDKARAGHHNDCFLASRDDVGTYRIAPTWEKNYLNKENRYVPMGGETCTPRDGSMFYGCENAIKELEKMRWSFLNSAYYRGILDHWRTEGCMPDVERRLGYRFALTEGRYTSSAAPGTTFRLELDLENHGFASPYNPRGLQAVLRSTSNPDLTYEVNLPADPRFWMAGESQQLRFDLGIPATLPEGSYTLHLFLPDPIEALRDRPEFAIRLANDGVWEEETGYNDLNHTVVVSGAAGGEPYTGTRWFVDREEAITSVQAAEPTGGAHLHQNTPNPFSGEATIRFELAEPAFVTVEVFDAMGRRVARLADAHHAAGLHDVRFDGHDLPAGAYFYRLSTSTGVHLTRPMTLVR